MPSNSIQDLAIFKEQQVVILNPSGQFVGVWADAPLLAGFKETINSGTSPLQVELPRPFDNFGLVGSLGASGNVGQGYIVQYWLFGPGLPTTGKLRYQGVIDSYTPQIKENGQESVTVTITPYSSVLGDRGIIGTHTFGTAGQPSTYVDAVTMFNYWFTTTDPVTGVTYAHPLTLAGGNPASSGNTAQYTFQNQTLLSIFETIMLMLPPSWFYRMNPDNTVTLQAESSTAQHILDLGQHVVNPQYTQDWTQLRNVIYFTGASQTVGGLSVPIVTATATGADLATFGERIYFSNDSRVTDQQTASTLAQGLLTQLDRYTLRTKIRVPDYRGSPNASIGYDIESLQVGDTVQLFDNAGAPSSSAGQAVWDVAFWDNAQWDNAYQGALSPVAAIISLDYNWYYVDIELGALQPSQDLALFKVQQRFTDFTMV